MRYDLFQLFVSLILIPAVSTAKLQQDSPGKNAILLSNVQSLTLRSGHQTTGRRLQPLPQLICIGSSRRVCKLYTIDTMRCVNDGFGYDEEDVQWTCSASLPPEFRLGSTDVVCEGYRNPDDRYVLKGSCAVEYQLLLTNKGEELFGSRMWKSSSASTWLNRLVTLFCLSLVIALFGFIFLRWILDCPGWNRGRHRLNRQHHGWEGFWGDDSDYGSPSDQPPPYSRYPWSAWFGSGAPSPSSRPSFWIGALSGATIGYELGRRSGGPPTTSRRQTCQRLNTRNDPGERSSRPKSSFSATATSTGFGSTRRR